MMEIEAFVQRYREAFGEHTPLPIGFWYGDEPLTKTEKVGGCILKLLETLAQGHPVSLNAENIGCGGGKLYCGFAPMPDHVPHFVSEKERYKQTPELVRQMIEELQIPKAHGWFLNLVRVDKLPSFDKVEGLLFLAAPDVLSGLVSWATFDTNAPGAVSALFGSGCCNAITQTIKENAAGGARTFLGLFDPSARPFVAPDVLSFAVPMSRFAVMYRTMRQTCLFDSHAWGKVKERIEPKKYDVAKIRTQYPNAYKPWSEEEDHLLERLLCEGKEIKELSEHFGRKKGAIESRIEKLELITKYR